MLAAYDFIAPLLPVAVTLFGSLRMGRDVGVKQIGDNFLFGKPLGLAAKVVGSILASGRGVLGLSGGRDMTDVASLGDVLARCLGLVILRVLRHLFALKSSINYNAMKPEEDIGPIVG